MKDLAIYVHIPFCKQKCKYCDFNSYVGKQNLVSEYIGALESEICSYASKAEEYKVMSVYFGGGTPSFIMAEEIGQVLERLGEHYSFSDFPEITLEANPGTIDEEKLKKYREYGINRLSFGVQACQDRILTDIGRIHTFEDAVRGYYMARNVGFENISLDLMFGLPNQTLLDMEESLDRFIELDPEHISSYSLKVEENTVFGKMQKAGQLELPSEELEREMYYLMKEKLKDASYRHYEISNFAKVGYESRHNSAYWKRVDYLGFGAGAASCFEERRFSNEESLEKYIEKAQKMESLLVYEEKLTKEVIHSEEIILGLRMQEGVKKELFREGKEQEALEKLMKYGLLEERDGMVKLTDRGLDLANQVFVEFI